jgi:ribonucleoside-triphosphate reductase (formate)
MATRKKHISDLTRRGVNPILADNTQFMQRSNVSLVVNLVGLNESVYKILGHPNDKSGKEILHKVLQTAVDVSYKKGQELDLDVSISMIEDGDLSRFVTLDGEKYGKNSIMDIMNDSSYSQGIILNSEDVGGLTTKSEIIVDCNTASKILNGGLLTKLKFDRKTKQSEIKNVIEKTSMLISSFKPVKPISICGNCGYKNEKLIDKCPTCKSQYII